MMAERKDMGETLGEAMERLRRQIEELDEPGRSMLRGELDALTAKVVRKRDEALHRYFTEDDFEGDDDEL